MLDTACRQTGRPGTPCTVRTVTSEGRESAQWKIYGERLVDENPFIRLSIASVGLPDGTEFEQYVMRMRRTATTVVVDDQDRVLLMRRHRFIVDRWVWELPGGYVDPAEDPVAAAAREVEEETGWRPVQKPEFVMTFQPMIGNADSGRYWDRTSDLLGVNEALSR